MMYDPEYTISMYFNADEALTQADIDRLSRWIRISDENAAIFIQASFMHRAIHDNLVGIDITQEALLVLEAANSDCQMLLDTEVSVEGLDMNDAVSGENMIYADYNDLSSGRRMTRDMLELLELERTSPAVEIHKEQPPRQLIQKVVYPKADRHKLTKFQKFQIAFAACFMGLLIYFSYAPQPLPLPVVADLVDSRDALWDDDMQTPGYYGEMEQSTYCLKDGLVSIRFRDGAKVTVQAPAKWSLLGGGNMELFNGRIYVVVPKKAHGFTVMAGNSKIVDLGTEFGVEVDTSNNTQLQVTKGKTLLFTGLLNGDESQVKVDAGASKKIYSDGFVKDVEVADNYFVRDIKTPLKVPNPSFETRVANADIWNNTKKVPLWSTPPWIAQYKLVGTDTWTLDLSPNAGAVVPNAAYGYRGIAADGKNLGYVNTHPSNDHCLYQQLEFSIQPLRIYELSVKVGNPSLYNKGAAAAYRVELLAGGVVIASKSGPSPADDSTWITASVSYTSGTDKTADKNIGKPMAIRLVAEAFTEKKHINFDDVQLFVRTESEND